MTESLYAIGETAVFQPEFIKYENGEGHYFEVGFANLGGIRHSNDGTKVLLEELESKFLPEHLAGAEFKGTREECLAYINARPEEWKAPAEEE